MPDVLPHHLTRQYFSPSLSMGVLKRKYICTAFEFRYDVIGAPGSQPSLKVFSVVTLPISTIYRSMYIYVDNINLVLA